MWMETVMVSLASTCSHNFSELQTREREAGKEIKLFLWALMHTLWFSYLWLWGLLLWWNSSRCLWWCVIGLTKIFQWNPHISASHFHLLQPYCLAEYFFLFLPLIYFTLYKKYVSILHPKLRNTGRNSQFQSDTVSQESGCTGYYQSARGNRNRSVLRKNYQIFQMCFILYIYHLKCFQSDLYNAIFIACEWERYVSPAHLPKPEFDHSPCPPGLCSHYIILV